MSTKVFDAYRIPLEKLNEEILRARTKVLDKIESCIRNSYIPLRISEDKLKELKLDKLSHESIACGLALFIAEKANKGNERQLGDLECWLNVWFYDGWVYIHPGASSSPGLLESIGVPEYGEDYAYWNNSDVPEWVESPEDYDDKSTWPESFKKWESRGEFWEDIADEVVPRLTVDLFSVKNYPLVTKLEERFNPIKDDALARDSYIAYLSFQLNDIEVKNNAKRKEPEQNH